MSTAAKIGIAIGAVIGGLAILASLVLLILLLRRRGSNPSAATTTKFSELSPLSRSELPSSRPSEQAELEGAGHWIPWKNATVNEMDAGVVAAAAEKPGNMGDERKYPDETYKISM